MISPTQVAPKPGGEGAMCLAARHHIDFAVPMPSNLDDNMGGPPKAIQAQTLFGLDATALQGAVTDNPRTQKRSRLH